MSGEEALDEFTVLMKVLDIVDRRLQASSSRDMNQNQRAQVVQIIEKVSNSSFVLSTSSQGVIVGDSYTVGQTGAVGPNAHAENVSFQQIWQQSAGGLDTAKLAEELATLRDHLRQSANTPEQDESIAEISKARVAATDNDGPRALEHLRKAGKWALSGATAIGTAVAAAAIKAAIGI